MSLLTDVTALQGDYNTSLSTIKSIVDVPSTICIMSILKDYNPITYWHSLRVMNTTCNLAEYLNLDFDLQSLLEAALLHDVGKLLIPASILDKTTTLNDVEWSIMKKHSTYSKVLLELLKYNDKVCCAVEEHHERLCGGGYPLDCKGDSICVNAQIIAVVDVFDAISNKRSYKDALSVSNTLKVMESIPGLNTVVLNTLKIYLCSVDKLSNVI